MLDQVSNENLEWTCNYRIYALRPVLTFWLYDEDFLFKNDMHKQLNQKR